MKERTTPGQKSPWETRIHDCVRDSFWRQIRKIGAAAKSERVAPHWPSRLEDKNVGEHQGGEDRCGRHRLRQGQKLSVLQGMTTKLAEAEAHTGEDSDKSRGGRPQLHACKCLTGESQKELSQIEREGVM